MFGRDAGTRADMKATFAALSKPSPDPGWIEALEWCSQVRPSCDNAIEPSSDVRRGTLV